jgi:outer membrane lipoprotein carrier protein
MKSKSAHVGWAYPPTICVFLRQPDGGRLRPPYISVRAGWRAVLLLTVIAGPLLTGHALGKDPATQPDPAIETLPAMLFPQEIYGGPASPRRRPAHALKVFVAPSIQPTTQLSGIPADLFTAFVSNPSDPPATQPAPTSAPVKASMELISHLQTQLKTVSSIEADFVQEKQLSLLKHKLTIKGHFALLKPDKLIWIVREPVKYAIRIEGDEIRQWDEDTNKVQVIHLGGDPTFQAVNQQLQAWFMGDYKTLGDNYEADLLAEHPLQLAFRPKGDAMMSKVIKQIDLTFGKSEMYVDRMVIRESGGDVTTLQFLNTQLNQPIPKEIWEIPPHER